MIGNSVSRRIASFINRAEHDPSLYEFEHLVHKAALINQGANETEIIGAPARDALIMLRAVAHHAQQPQPIHPIIEVTP